MEGREEAGLYFFDAGYDFLEALVDRLESFVDSSKVCVEILLRLRVHTANYATCESSIFFKSGFGSAPTR